MDKCKIDGCNNEVRANGMCKMHYQKNYFHGDPNYKAPWVDAPTTCIVEGCECKVTRKTAKMCEKHYYRQRRTGSTNDTKRSGVVKNSNGYLKQRLPSHPLSDSQGYVYIHRKVLFDSGPIMVCAHCGAKQSWSTCHVDHLDDDKTNNKLSNLCISCSVCNTSRGKYKMIKKIRDMNAVHTYNGETMCLIEWARNIGISHQALQYRLDHWNDIDMIFTSSRGKFGPLKKTAEERGRR